MFRQSASKSMRRRFTSTFIGLYGLVALISAASGQARPEVFCGLGPPPGSPSLASYQARRSAQQSALGYVLVCEADFERFMYHRQVQPLEAALRGLTFKPIDLSGTPFSAFELVGAIPDHFNNHEPYALRRVFMEPQSQRTLSVFEWDMQAVGGSIKWMGDDATVPVLGSQAHVVSLRSPAGLSHVSLTWVSDGRLLEVSSFGSGQPNPDEARHLQGLAEAVARAQGRR